jgi:AcrR family transcriptional regulator
MARPRSPDLRERLIRAATGEFSERGFKGAAMARIAGRAGVTKGGVYFHFRSKEELFFAVLDHWDSGLRGALRPAMAQGAGGADAVRATIGSFLGFHFRHPQASGLLRVLQAELQSGFTAQVREDLGGGLRSLRARMRELFAQGARDGSLFAGDPALAAFLLAAAVEGVIQQWRASPRDTAPFCDAETLADALVAPYATGARAAVEAAGRAAAGEDLSPPF